MKRALITGITGQDGSFLAELLLKKGYEVHGLIRRTSSFSTGRIDHLYVEPHLPECKLFLQFGDLSDGGALRHLLGEVQPDEVYNLAAQSHVRVSFQQPEYTADVTGLGVLRLLNALRDVQEQLGKPIRFYQASSSEMYGNAPNPPYDEATPFRPRSPYACSKVFAHWQTVNYREAYGMFACNGILFNHESERRGETFVTRKISRAVGRIKVGLQDEMFLGNLDAVRDWGYAQDFVEAMWLMLQQDEPDDYVIATGESHSVREFLDEAFGYVGLNWQDFVKFDKYYLRPTEVDCLVGDASKAKQALGWEPKVGFKDLVHRMVDHDLEAAKRAAHAAEYDKGRSG